MAKPLRSQLNQIRAWVRQGRTDAWIAHQLDVSTSELREFRRRHELDAEEENGEDDLRDEIEAEIEAAAREEEATAAAREEEEAAREEEAAAEEAAAEEVEEAERAAAPGDGEEGDEEPAEAEEAPRRRRRRRRGGRGRRGGRKALQATFDHGEDEGYGLWLDPAVKDDPVYGEHWADARRIEVTIEPDQIVIRRSQSD